ncbi:hypothetical protein TSOC_008403 [Tetrabaena socialis]|uniref:RFTS domain-containing protein n=1 Tax=Tetrabaena socialis TaxID=47790 RepID=A0A2J7ZYI7_9CHLO|nr:hypothetical protein TSOC_008403 [Tetrabaena socialis]|eukprot:PNH05332.1 hypothetical protein TSOC_008403 [Tetrabaena socialis]
MASPPPENEGQELPPVPVKTEDAGLPTRKIFDFTIVNAGNAAVSLEALHSLPAGSLLAVGMVPTAEQVADGEEKIQPCRTHPITDWIIHYGDNPGVYISTEKAWCGTTGVGPEGIADWRELRTAMIGIHTQGRG